MRYLILVSLLLSTLLLTCRVSPSPSQQISQVTGQGGSNRDTVTSMVLSPDQQYIYISGSFTSSTTFGNTSLSTSSAGNSYMFVAKLRSNNSEVVWVVTGSMGSAAQASPTDIKLSSDGSTLFVLGYFTGDLQICGSGEYTSPVAAQFQATFNTDSGSCSAFSYLLNQGTTGIVLGGAFDLRTDDSLVIAGTFSDNFLYSSCALTSSGLEDISIIKYSTLNSAYKCVWAIKMGGSGNDRGLSIVTASENSAYVTGRFESAFQVTLIDNSQPTVTSSGGTDVFIVKLDSEGKLLWITRAGGITNDEGKSIALGQDGYVYVTGSFTGNATFGSFHLVSSGLSDVFIAKLDPALGHFVWVVQSGGTGADSGNSISVGNNGAVYVAGQFEGNVQFSSDISLTSGGNTDAFVASYDETDGKVLWAVGGGGIEQDYSSRIVVANDKSTLYSSGNFKASALFGAFDISSAGDFDVYVAQHQVVTCSNLEANSSHVCSENGVCKSKDNCVCIEGYTGNECELPVCFGFSQKNKEVCSNHGSCISPNNCSCSAGWWGEACNYTTCFGLNNTDANACSGNGSCLSEDYCSCYTGYVGEQCSILSCFGYNETSVGVCSGNGRCVGVDQCECDTDWFGDVCDITMCFNISSNDPSVCSGKGACISVDYCICNHPDQFFGSECELTTCFGHNSSSDNVCSGHGSCLSFDSCSCEYGYGGINCSIHMCDSILHTNTNVCSGHGACIDVDTCNCSSHYAGKFCDTFTLECFGHNSSSENICSGHGQCIHFDNCSCEYGYGEIDCSIHMCGGILHTNASVCSGHGVCIGVDTCNCSSNSTGSFCGTSTTEPGGPNPPNENQSSPPRYRKSVVIGATVGSIVGLMVIIIISISLIAVVCLLVRARGGPKMSSSDIGLSLEEARNI